MTLSRPVPDLLTGRQQCCGSAFLMWIRSDPNLHFDAGPALDSIVHLDVHRDPALHQSDGIIELSFYRTDLQVHGIDNKMIVNLSYVILDCGLDLSPLQHYLPIPPVMQARFVNVLLFTSVLYE
jgi:hypothetical protein